MSVEATRPPHATSLETVRRFYREQVPGDLAASLARQRDAARDDPEAARILEEMEAVRASIVVRVGHPDGIESFAYEIERGEPRPCATPTRVPFLQLAHALADFDGLRRECGASLLGFLGSLVGRAEGLRLTAARVRSLRELAGSVRIERPGRTSYSIRADFGVDAPAPSADAVVRIDDDLYDRLRQGALDAQDAYLAGDIEVEGDEGRAIGLALAMLAPD